MHGWSQESSAPEASGCEECGEAQRRLDECYTKLDDVASRFSKKLADTHEELAAERAQADEARFALTAFEKEHAKLADIRTNLEEDLAKAKKVSKERVSKSEAALAALQKKHIPVQARAEKAEIKLADARQLLSAANTERDDLQRRLDAELSAKRELDQKLVESSAALASTYDRASTAEAELASLRIGAEAEQELAEALESELSSARAQHAACQERACAAQDEVATLRSEYATLQERLDTTQHALSSTGGLDKLQMQREFADCSSTMAATEDHGGEALEAQLFEAQEACVAWTARSEAAELKLSDVQQRHATDVAQRNQLQDELAECTLSLDVKVAAVEEECAVMITRAQEAEASCENLQSQLVHQCEEFERRLDEEVASKNASLTQVAQYRSALDLTAEQHERHVALMDGECASLRSRFLDIERTCVDLEGQLVQANVNNEQRLGEELSHKNEALMQLSQLRKVLEVATQNHKSHVVAMEKQCASLRLRVQEAEAMCGTLERRLVEANDDAERRLGEELSDKNEALLQLTHCRSALDLANNRHENHVAAMDQQCTSLRARAHDAVAMCEDLNRRLVEAHEDAERRLDDEVSRKNEALMQLSQVCSELDLATENHKEHAAAIEEQRATLRSHADDVRAAYEDLEKQLSQEACERKELQEQLIGCQASLETANNSVSSHLALLTASQEDCADLQIRAEKAEAIRDVVQKRLATEVRQKEVSLDRSAFHQSELLSAKRRLGRMGKVLQVQSKLSKGAWVPPSASDSGVDASASGNHEHGKRTIERLGMLVDWLRSVEVQRRKAKGKLPSAVSQQEEALDVLFESLCSEPCVGAASRLRRPSSAPGRMRSQGPSSQPLDMSQKFSTLDTTMRSSMRSSSRHRPSSAAASRDLSETNRMIVI